MVRFSSCGNFQLVLLINRHTETGKQAQFSSTASFSLPATRPNFILILKIVTTINTDFHNSSNTYEKCSTRDAIFQCKTKSFLSCQLTF